jgi:cytochrome b
LASDEEREPGLLEALLVWALFALVAAAVLATYARLPPEDLYNVSGTGVEAGASRALVFLGYPVSLAALAVLGIVADRVRRPAATAVALAAALLCATVVWPGVVDQSDLDARPVNALAGVGVVLAVALTGLALARGGVGRSPPFGGWDAARAGLAAVVLVASLPWVTAELGLLVDLDPVFLSEEPRPEPGHPTLTAVHLGHHHGMDGALLALAALALSRSVSLVRGRRLRLALGFYVSLMLVYGLANALQDFWLEQLVKRGTTSARIPDMLRPELSPEWAALLAAALVIHLAALHVGKVRPLRQGGSP